MTMTKQPGQETGEALPIWDEDRMVAKVEAIAASWYRVLDRDQVSLLRGQILALVREIRTIVIDQQNTISQLVNNHNQLVDEVRQLEAQLDEMRGDSGPNPVVKWKKWDVELAFGEEGSDE